MGLRSKLLGSLLLLLVLPLMALGTVGYWLVKQQFYEEALVEQHALTGRAAEVARREIAQSYNRLYLMAGNGQLINGLQRYLVEPLEQHAQVMRQAFEKFLIRNNTLIELGVYGADGRFIESSLTRSGEFSRYYGFDASIEPQAWLQDNIHLEQFSEIDQRKVFRLGTPIRDFNREVIGYLVLNTNSSGLERVVAGRESDTTHVFFSDDDGFIMAASNELGIDHIPQAVMQQFAQASTTAQFVRIDIDGRPFELSMQKVGAIVWLGSLLDLQAVYTDISRLMLVLLAAAALLVTLVALFFYSRVAKIIIRPIDNLIDATRKISSGDYLPVIDIDSGDEIGELAESFRVMGTRLKESNDRVTQLAFFDPLTKLPNRETLRRALSRMIDAAGRQGSLLGILFIDLDDFKKVNDRLGHAAGDELLVEVGRRLTLALRSSDVLVGGVDPDAASGDSMISRRGGDEFNAILANVKSARDIAHIAERLIEDINEPIMLDGNPVCVSASVGVAIYPFDGEDADNLLRNADLAMYEAKVLGKNKYYLFTQAINNQVHDRLRAEQRISEGLQRAEFELYFQPKISLQDMSLTGFEALIRWKNPQQGLLSPSEFMPLAEESQLIHDIGRWTVAEVFDHVRNWDSVLPKNLRIAVNISARQLVQESFAENFISLAGQFGIPLSRLEVELTENGIFTDESLVKAHLQKLSEADVKISLDDFGTGLTSLSFLRTLPIDCVKIDKSFIQTTDSSEESAEIVSALLQLCNRLGLETIAEGVETEAQLQFLKDKGCNQCQGYYFSMPIAADQVVGYLSSDAYLES